MAEERCVFHHAVMAGAVCVHAEAVTRRAGPDIVCHHQNRAHCAACFQQWKQAALVALGMEDNLLTMPHSVGQKIQIGAIEVLKNHDRQNRDSLDQLIQHGANGVSMEVIVAGILACKPRRVKKR